MIFSGLDDPVMSNAVFYCISFTLDFDRHGRLISDTTYLCDTIKTKFNTKEIAYNGEN